jgi:hypothetical protein
MRGGPCDVERDCRRAERLCRGHPFLNRLARPGAGRRAAGCLLTVHVVDEEGHRRGRGGRAARGEHGAHAEEGGHDGQARPGRETRASSSDVPPRVRADRHLWIPPITTAFAWAAPLWHMCRARGGFFRRARLAQFPPGDRVTAVPERRHALVLQGDHSRRRADRCNAPRIPMPPMSRL